jgi:2'-5' RNA ligase
MKKIKPRFSYSIWAVFNSTQNKEFFIIKKKVNKILKGPFFPIHMTILNDLVGSKKDLIKKMFFSLKKIQKFSIELKNYGYKKKFFQSLYINVKKNRELNKQKKILDRIFKHKSKIYSPHISLYYGQKNTYLKKKIISSLPKMTKTIKIKHLSLALNDEKKLQWKILKTFQI